MLMAKTRKSSEDTEVYLIGETKEHFCGRKLPSKTEVLQVFFYHRNVFKETKDESAKRTIEKCFSFWKEANIPTRSKYDAVKQLLRLFDKWVKAGASKHRSKTSDTQRIKEMEFKDDLENLFDLSHQDAIQTMTYVEDKHFLCAQREKGRRGYLAFPIDTSTLNNFGQNKDIEVNLCMNESILDDPNNYVWSEDEELEEDVKDNFDYDKALEDLKTNSLESNPNKKIKLMTPDLCINLDRSNVSDRKAARILAAVLKSLGFHLDETVISRQTIRRHRIKFRKNISEEIKKKFDGGKTKLIVQWDGKLLPDLGNINKKVDRLPVLVSSADVNELLGIPKLENGTGEAQAVAIIELLKEWEILEEVVGMCFDTTASNSGPSNGTCAILERKLGRSLLHLACRHHIHELPIKAVYEQCMGPTSGPEVLLFKRFQAKWPELNHNNYEYGIDDKEVAIALENQKADIIEFASNRLKDTQPRGDYKELLELIIIFMGAKPRKDIRFKLPGAIHHARWMGKGLYALKLFLFREEFYLTSAEVHGLRKVCLFIVLFYQKPWFTAHRSVAAAYTDLSLVQQLIDCSVLDAKICNVALTKILSYLWYLSEELIGFAFFDKQVTLECKRKMANAIKERPGTEVPSKRLVLDLKQKNYIKNLTLDQLVTTNTIKLFEKLNIPKDFLNFDPETWQSREDYQFSLNVILGLPVTNDSAERGVALISEYNSKITRDEEQLQKLMLNMNFHRSIVPDSDKESLKKSLEDYIFRQ